jgi:hypothetical protein
MQLALQTPFSLVMKINGIGQNESMYQREKTTLYPKRIDNGKSFQD